MDDMDWYEYEDKCRSEVSEITLRFSNGQSDVIRAVSTIDYICKMVAYNKMPLKEYLEEKYARETYNQSDNSTVTGVVIKTRGQELEAIASKFLRNGLRKTKISNGTLDDFSSTQKEQESEDHKRVKNEVIRTLNENGFEAFSEVTFFNEAPEEYYKTLLERKRQDPDYVVRQSYENSKFGNMFIADVAAWITNSGVAYPLVTVEVMVSSDVRKEINNLSDYSYPTAYRMIIDGYGKLHGILNGVPIFGLSQFKDEFATYFSKLKDLLAETRDIWKLIERIKEH